jgi:hypothetical protein
VVNLIFNDLLTSTIFTSDAVSSQPMFEGLQLGYKPDLGSVPIFAADLPSNLPLGKLADISFGGRVLSVVSCLSRASLHAYTHMHIHTHTYTHTHTHTHIHNDRWHGAGLHRALHRHPAVLALL